MTNLKIIETQLDNKKEQDDFLYVLDTYATDIMGGGESIPKDTQQKMITEIQKFDHKIILLAYLDDQPAGLANSFVGFSTFKGKKLINLHDFAVVPEYRGKGIGKAILEHLEEIARKMDCCKLTLEVLEGNKKAMKLYQDFGFEGYELDPEMGKALFMQKSLL